MKYRATIAIMIAAVVITSTASAAYAGLTDKQAVAKADAFVMQLVYAKTQNPAKLLAVKHELAQAHPKIVHATCASGSKVIGIKFVGKLTSGWIYVNKRGIQLSCR